MGCYKELVGPKKSCDIQFHKYESPSLHKWPQPFHSLSSFYTLFHLLASEYSEPMIIHFVCTWVQAEVGYVMGSEKLIIFLMVQPLEAR